MDKRNIQPVRLVAALLLLWGGSVQATAAVIESVRLWRAPDNTRLVFDLSGSVEHRIFPLKNPDRLVIDIENARLKGTLEDLSLGDTPISNIRYASRDNNGLRVVLDLRSSVRPKSFTLGANEQYGDRLVIDLNDPQEVRRSVEEIVQHADRDIIIAIDAGHGGEDPGALGPKKVREKEVALQIARRLEKLFDNERGFRGELVRSGDYYIPHRKRTEIAHDARADFFVSIHADAFTNPAANGASVYALSQRGATSETARFLAQKENRADLIGGVGTLSLDDKDEVLAGVLLDLSMTATLSSSLDAGKRVLQRMGKVARLHKKQVEQAGFLVLKSPDMPSLLVETGFISNPTEAKRLSQAGYQQEMANAVFTGLVEYFNAQPPVGSWLASRQSSGERVYVVVRGDTLSGVAYRHNTSVERLISYNKLSSDSVRVGQKIRIPSS